MSGRLPRRTFLGASAACGAAVCGAGVSLTSSARAFGEDGAFHARFLVLDDKAHEEELSAARRWAWELTRRSSAPGRLAAKLVRPDATDLLEEPFAVWSGNEDPGALSPRAIRNLRQYLRMGGMIVVDDRATASGKGTFGPAVRRELQRVLPEDAAMKLPAEHVVYKTYYILEQPLGRRPGPEYIEAIVRGKTAQVLFLDHDLVGALARRGDTWAYPMESGGSEGRERALRFAVNIAMYALCSDYKDDQVHAPFLMRRRHKNR